MAPVGDVAVIARRIGAKALKLQPEIEARPSNWLLAGRLCVVFSSQDLAIWRTPIVQPAGVVGEAVLAKTSVRRQQRNSLVDALQ
jgi:hypothetical protein